LQNGADAADQIVFVYGLAQIADDSGSQCARPGFFFNRARERFDSPALPIYEPRNTLTDGVVNVDERDQQRRLAAILTKSASDRAAILYITLPR
jgi:hypothetical protein